MRSRRSTSAALRSHREGFSLLELLVVILIIVLLLALLIPVLSNSKQAGKTTVCLNTMHQLGVACSGYVAANKDTYPQPVIDPNIPAPARETGLWFNALDDYLGRPT